MKGIDWQLAWQYFQLFASAVLVPVFVAFIKSEKMALDNSTQGNGIYHWYKLAKQALSIATPEEIKAIEDSLPKVAQPIAEAILAPVAQPTPVQAPAPAAGVAAIVTNNTGGTTMKMLVSLLVVMALAASVALADTTPPASTAVTTVAAPGWGPSVVGSVGAFYFNGSYSLLNGGAFVGAAYGFTDKAQNVNSVGFYAGPSSQLINGVTTTTINAMVYLNLYQTASMGGFGVGLGTRLWQSGLNMGNAIGASTTYLALGYKF